MRELQTIFETPPRYGKNIQWQEHAFTPHDVASIFRRFLTYMPVSDLFYTPLSRIFPFPFPSSYSLKLASERHSLDETLLASQKPIHSNGRWPFPSFIPPPPPTLLHSRALPQLYTQFMITVNASSPYSLHIHLLKHVFLFRNQSFPILYTTTLVPFLIEI
jgi:hypothetical protein